MSLSELPPDLPVPLDDGAADHLGGCRLPDVVLTATNGAQVALGSLEGLWILYVYPMTGRPGEPLPDGWDRMPGARGCTPQACALMRVFTASARNLPLTSARRKCACICHLNC